MQTLSSLMLVVVLTAPSCAALLATGVGQPARSHLGVATPTAEDVAVIELRQLGHKVSNLLAVGARCKHGHPQAFAFDPLARPSVIATGRERSAKLDSGLFRLACPLLVKAIDEWEAEGAVEQLNAEIQRAAAIGEYRASGAGGVAARRLSLMHAKAEERGEPIPLVTREMVQAANAGHAAARAELVGDRLEQQQWVDDGGEGEEQEGGGSGLPAQVAMALASGISGMTPSKPEVKCLHAQLADYLCRGGDNAVGARILRGLEARGVETSGCDACTAQCSLRVPEEEARERFWYTPAKNRWKLRKRMIRRTERKGLAVVEGAAD